MGQTEKPLRVVGKNIERIGALDLVLGKAKFSGDILMKGLLHLKILRSTFPHALIKAIDTEQASKLPGVVRIFTGKDIPGNKRVGTIIKDQPVLVEDRVRYKGDPIALVVAETEEDGEEALEHIKIHYEELEPVLTPERALEMGAPKIHETGNLLFHQLITKGDIEKGFQEADVIVERTYTTPWVEHACLEPDAGIAYLDEEGRIILYVSTQNPFYDQKEVADVLGLGLDRVRVIQAPTGGGFGSKLDVTVQCYLGLAAFYIKRPVKLVFTREEVFEATSKRHPMKIQFKTGVTKEGKLTAVQARILGDTGAYASYGTVVATRAVIHATGPYEVPNFKAESVMVYTNNIWSGAMRGFGAPQVAFAHKSQMDILAEKLGMDPIDFRLRNVLKKGSSTGTEQILHNSVGIGKTLERLKEWRGKNISEEVVPGGYEKNDRIVKGIGVASVWFRIGNAAASNPSTIKVEIDRNGNIVLSIGTADIGQGSNTVLTQIAAEELGIKTNEIHLVCADISLTMDAGATAASRQTYISGNAVRNACMNLKEILFKEVRDLYNFSDREFFLKNKKVVFRGLQRISIPLTEIADRVYREGRHLRGEGFFNHNVTQLDPRTGQGKPYTTYAFASQLAEVEVDRETGEVHVRRIVAAHDVGKAINPMNVIGQINGGVAMGVGFALSEEFIPGQTNSYFNYFIPTIKDIPEIVSIIVEDEEPTGPFVAKGIGEPALIPTAPAILNAIAKAIGSRVYDLPATLEKVQKATKSQEKEN
jgi:CO/xanthine dehydrogenase Mo-binding subunit